MIKKVILTTLVSFLSLGTVFASSYIDRQIKMSERGQKYGTAQKHTAVYNAELFDAQKTQNNILKDPKLIKFKSSDIKKISDADFNRKLKKDQEIYEKLSIYNHLDPKKEKNNLQLAKDYDTLYRVFDRLIRANGLDYISWRIGIDLISEEINAHASDINLVTINTSLLDTMYDNEPGLAMVLAHELGHQLLSHGQIKYDMATKSEKTSNVIYYSTFGWGNLVYNPIKSSMNKKKFRQMEHEADALGLELAIRAGYEYKDLIKTMQFLSAGRSANEDSTYHPKVSKRIEYLQGVKKYLLSSWVDEGRYKIYTSQPLPLKISPKSDFITLAKQDRPRQDYYELETPEEVLKRIGYIEYKSANMPEAIKCFKRWAEISNSFIPHLYISYSYEYLYNQTQKPAYLDKAIESAKLANLISSGDKNATKQLEDLNNL